MKWMVWLLGCLLVPAMLLSDCSAAGYTWTSIGPTGGYVSSVAYDPIYPNTIWASGDDSDGLYVSLDSGAHWGLVPGVPSDQSTFSLTIDPVNHNIYAPNHYGRGMLRSTDGGNNWSQSTIVPRNTKPPQNHVYSLAINPTSRNILVVATDAGLYKSIDYGNSFNKITTNWGTVFEAVAYGSDGTLYAGNTDLSPTSGTLEYSRNNGEVGSWNLIFTGNGAGIAKLVTTSNALYVLYNPDLYHHTVSDYRCPTVPQYDFPATLFYLALPSFSPNGFLNPTGTINIQTGLRTDLAAVATDNNQAHDLLYFGTSVTCTSSTQWGLFRSTTGGASFTRMASNFAGNSVFSIAINPQNSNQVAVGTVNSNGIFITTDGGTTWNQKNYGITANAALGFAQDPAISQYMLVSSSVSLGLGKSYFTIDGGSTWNIFPEVVSTDGILSLDIDPGNYNNLLAGSFTQGIYRSTTGPYGPWTQVEAPPPAGSSGSQCAGGATQLFIKILRDKNNSNAIFALNPTALYLSGNDGASFAPLTGTIAVDYASHPTNAGEGIIAGYDVTSGVTTADVYVSTTYFFSKTPLGLGGGIGSSESGFTAVAYDPSNPSIVLAAGTSGTIYKATNYNTNGTPLNWTAITPQTTGISNATIRNLVIVHRTNNNNQDQPVYYAAAFSGDVCYSTPTTPGVFRSINNGAWTRLSGNGLLPSDLVWNFAPLGSSPNTFVAPMYGGSVMKLVDNDQ